MSLVAASGAALFAIGCAKEASKPGAPSAARIGTAHGKTPPLETSAIIPFPKDDLASVLEPIRVKHGLPALGAAVFDSKSALALGVTGVRKIGTDVLTTKSDRFHLGSDTKAMTATLVARAIERGELKWTTTLGEIYGKENVHPGYQPVTIEQLLGHRGGAPANAQEPIWKKMWETHSESRAPRRVAVLEMLKLGPTLPVGSWSYSNAGYIMAGAALERGAPSWEDRLRADVFEPLAMSECGFGPAETLGKTDQPLGHSVKDGKLIAETGWADNPRSLGPAGTVNCSLLSWGNFLRAHLRGALGETTYLPSASWTKLHTPAPLKDPKEKSYALGWIVVEQPWTKGPAFTHHGSNTMNLSAAWITPGLDRVFIVTTNSAGQESDDAVQEALLKLIAAYGK